MEPRELTQEEIDEIEYKMILEKTNKFGFFDYLGLIAAAGFVAWGVYAIATSGLI